MTYSLTQSQYDFNQPDHHLQRLKQMKKIALVVEGGGMRSMFSAGVLDSFYELEFDPFQLFLGVSAGSLNLASHLAGQYLRNYRVMMFSADCGRFINPWNFLRGGHYIDLDWLFNECLESHPLNEKCALKYLQENNKEFIVVCTNVETGKAHYYCSNEKNFHEILIGSCCIPLLYRNPIYISDYLVMDGGISDPIPVKKAYEEGATDIVIIRSRAEDYRYSENQIVEKMGAYLYKNHSKLKKSILNSAGTYNNSIDFIENPPANINIVQIAPTITLGTTFMTTDTQLLERDYQHGKQLGKEFVRNWYVKPNVMSDQMSMNSQLSPMRMKAYEVGSS
jgi:predicted patatin/cPLA2 family phospholipase